jgi:Neocarzinostatin family
VITGPGHGIKVGSDGTFSAPFKVSRFVEDEDGQLDCAQPSTCVLEATNVGDPDQTASTPITFADVVIVPPVLTASPSADLVDGQNVTVTGTGFGHHDVLALTECKAGSSNQANCAGLDGEGNFVQVKTDARGRFTATFNVARVLTLVNGTVDCTVAPGCVIGAVEEEGLIQGPEAVTALSFNPAVPPLPPLNLELAIHHTGSLVAGAKGQTDAEITGTISCNRTTAVPVEFVLQVSQAGKRLTPGRFVTGEMTCRRGGAKFSETVPTSRRHPAVAGIAGVVMGLSAVSGSSSQTISVSAAVTLKAPKS